MRGVLGNEWLLKAELFNQKLGGDMLGATSHVSVEPILARFKWKPLLSMTLACVLFSLLSAASAECEAEDMRLELLQHKVELSRREDKVPAVISAMYTFGAPAVSRPAMPDLNQPDRCFRGLRTYTEPRSGVSQQHEG